ncbi:hypothetical protein X777_05397, partial [Ooceraea biroi]
PREPKSSRRRGSITLNGVPEVSRCAVSVSPPLHRHCRCHPHHCSALDIRDYCAVGNIAEHVERRGRKGSSPRGGQLANIIDRWVGGWSREEGEREKES